mmetsp:Transcript_32674/g.71898  ORF Transcript_32674/g.71898 Transcript_32674/m.71898 type:complete len:262 (+) Transcript_32674:6079-6864(+)
MLSPPLQTASLACRASPSTAPHPSNPSSAGSPSTPSSGRPDQSCLCTVPWPPLRCTPSKSWVMGSSPPDRSPLSPPGRPRAALTLQAVCSPTGPRWTLRAQTPRGSSPAAPPPLITRPARVRAKATSPGSPAAAALTALGPAARSTAVFPGAGRAADHPRPPLMPRSTPCMRIRRPVSRRPPTPPTEKTLPETGPPSPPPTPTPKACTCRAQVSSARHRCTAARAYRGRLWRAGLGMRVPLPILGASWAARLRRRRLGGRT